MSRLGSVAFLVSEKEQNASLNGDRDLDDFVLFLFDNATRTTENTLRTYHFKNEAFGAKRRAAPPFFQDTLCNPYLTRHFFAFPVAETNVDLNGDGDLDDLVTHIAVPRLTSPSF